jgi:hypothetical protein
MEIVTLLIKLNKKIIIGVLKPQKLIFNSGKKIKIFKKVVKNDAFKIEINSVKIK